MKYTKETLAALLNGREYGDEIDHAEEAAAKASGLVVVFGYSDDTVEFRGAAHDEMGCGSEGAFDIAKNGKALQEVCETDEMTRREWQEYEATKALGFRTIKAFFCRDGHEFQWEFETDIPNAAFGIFKTMNGRKEKFCRGIVFSLSDI